MRTIVQRTIQTSVSCLGVGLHSGKKVKLTIHPAPEDSGITFIRSDVNGSAPIQASLDNVAQANRATTLGLNGVSISTVEHLLSALTGLGVDNVRVEVSSPEVPIMDGSSMPFVFLLRAAGLKNQHRPKKFITLNRPLTVTDGDKFISAGPSTETEINFSIEFNHPLIKKQRYQFFYSEADFESRISRARTFGFVNEVEALKKQGLALGGSLDNCVVMDQFRILNKDGLRYENELVRHKVLDLIGDLTLLQAPLLGSLSVNKSGHALNHAFMKRLTENRNAWEPVEFRNMKEFLDWKTDLETAGRRVHAA